MGLLFWSDRFVTGAKFLNSRFGISQGFRSPSDYGSPKISSAPGSTNACINSIGVHGEFKDNFQGQNYFSRDEQVEHTN